MNALLHKLHMSILVHQNKKITYSVYTRVPIFTRACRLQVVHLDPGHYRARNLLQNNTNKQYGRQSKPWNPRWTIKPSLKENCINKKWKKKNKKKKSEFESKKKKKIILLILIRLTLVCLRGYIWKQTLDSLVLITCLDRALCIIVASYRWSPGKRGGGRWGDWTIEQWRHSLKRSEDFEPVIQWVIYKRSWNRSVLKIIYLYIMVNVLLLCRLYKPIIDTQQTNNIRQLLRVESWSIIIDPFVITFNTSTG